MKIRKFAYLLQRYMDLKPYFTKMGTISTISNVFNADIDVLLTIGASQCSQANLDKH